MSEDFAHRRTLDRIDDGDRLDLIASEAERQAIAARLGLASLDRLEAYAMLTRSGDIVRAKGRVQAALEQSCVVTGDPVAAHVDQPFELMFVPEPQATGGDDGIEIGEHEFDTVFHDGGGIDVGSAIADTLALAIDPYPRSAGADAVLREAGVLSEAEAGPFAALAKLKKKGEA